LPCEEAIVPCNYDFDCPSDTYCLGAQCVEANIACRARPTPGPFSPREAWSWTGSDNLGQYDHVLMTPVVVPLGTDPTTSDAFAPPAVVFNAIVGDVGAGEWVPGVMRAVDGATGRELWASDPAHLVNGLTAIAAGDLDGDGTVELVTGRLSNGVEGEEGLIAFGHDGRFLWEVKGLSVRWGAPSVAKLNGGPQAAVVVGDTVIDARGMVVCQAPAGMGRGDNGMGPISVVADVDLDGAPDIVTGSAIYDNHCQPKPGWPNGQWDGLVAVADFVGDAHPEIAVVSRGTVRLQDHQGGVLWGPVALPGGGSGGAPTVADFDGDGRPEIGVAGNSSYTVFKPFGPQPVLWSRTTQDESHVTGSSVFDFENDGKAEVVYGDECYTRVYDGTSGATLFEQPNPSCTVHENPVIADVDLDGRAEIVVGTNSVCAIRCPWGDHYRSGRKGVIALKDLRDRWVSTLPVWNQHAYSVTNVGEDGSLPFPAADNWRTEGLNNFRMNVIGDADHRAPDVAIGGIDDVSYGVGACPGRVAISIKVRNRGAVPVAGGLPVALYRERVGGELIQVLRTLNPILPGKYEVVTAELGDPGGEPFPLAIAVDDDGTGEGVAQECDEGNNQVQASGAFCADNG
jgi:hypothetical protein